MAGVSADWLKCLPSGYVVCRVAKVSACLSLLLWFESVRVNQFSVVHESWRTKYEENKENEKESG